MVINWGIDTIGKINFGVLSLSQQAVENINTLELPRDLKGKSVVELYSGDDDASVGRWVVASGGACTTVDIREIKNEPQHILGRAESVIKSMETDSTDFVLMFGPLWWNKNGLDDIEKTMGIIWESMRVIKKQSGNFVGMGTGFTEHEAEEILNKLKERPERFEGWSLEWGEPQVHKGQRNMKNSFLKIVRR